jgi:hypothetical protein
MSTHVSTTYDHDPNVTSSEFNDPKTFRPSNIKSRKWTDCPSNTLRPQKVGRSVTVEHYDPLVFLVSIFCDIKGNVQRKLRRVENGVNRSIGASDCGAGHSFVVLFGFHLCSAIFPFPVSTVQIIGKFWINR